MLVKWENKISNTTGTFKINEIIMFLYLVDLLNIIFMTAARINLKLDYKLYYNLEKFQKDINLTFDSFYRYIKQNVLNLLIISKYDTIKLGPFFEILDYLVYFITDKDNLTTGHLFSRNLAEFKIHYVKINSNTINYSIIDKSIILLEDSNRVLQKFTSSIMQLNLDSITSTFKFIDKNIMLSFKIDQYIKNQLTFIKIILIRLFPTLKLDEILPFEEKKTFATSLYDLINIHD
jgi:hypothetical protein